MKATSQPRRVKRLVKRALAIVLGLELLYVLVANVFLGTGLLRHLTNYEPRTTRIEYSRAWSVVPGLVHVDDLRIRGRDGNVEWLLRLDQARFRVAFTALIHKRFQASNVRIEGLSLRLRFRLGPDEPLGHIAALPDIPGFANPPLHDAPKPKPAQSDAEYDSWTVKLSDVDLRHVREVWIHTMRYTGDAHVTGRWSFEPDRSLEIGPAHAEIANLEAAYGEAAFVRNIHGQLDATIAPFDLRREGSAMLESFSASADLEGEVQTSLGLSSLIDVPGLSLVDGRGPAHVVARIEHGVLRPGTHLSSTPRAVEVGIGQVTVKSDLRFTFDVTLDEQGSSLGRAVAEGSDAHVQNPHAAATIDDARLSAESRRLDLYRSPFSDAVATLDARGARGDDLAAWTGRDALHTEGVCVETAHATWSYPAGRAHADAAIAIASVRASVGDESTFDARDARLLGHADVEIADAIARGVVDVTAAHARVRTGDLALSASLSSHLELGQLRWREDVVELGGSALWLRDAKVSATRKGRELPILSARVASAHVAALRVAPGGKSGGITVSIPRADFADASVLGSFVGLPAKVTLRHGVASGKVEAALDLASKTAKGELSVRVPDLTIGLGDRTMRGELRLRVVARRAGAVTDFASSTVSYQEARQDDVGPWWTTLAVRAGSLALTHEPRLELHVEGQARDATPATVLFAEKTDLPVWLVTLVKVENLRLAGEITAAPSSFALEHVCVTGDQGFLRAKYRDDHGRTSGSVTIGSGVAQYTFGAGDATASDATCAERWVAPRTAGRASP